VSLRLSQAGRHLENLMHDCPPCHCPQPLLLQPGCSPTYLPFPSPVCPSPPLLCPALPLLPACSCKKEEIHVEVHDGNVLRFGHNPNAEREKEDVEEEGECRAGSPAAA